MQWVCMWWMDGSRSDDGRVGSAAVCKPRDLWNTLRSNLGTGRMEVCDAELSAIGLAHWGSGRKRDTLQAPGVPIVAIGNNSHAVIRPMEHLELGPGQLLARWINLSVRTLREARIETEMHCVPGHSGVPRNKKADPQANLVQ